MPACVPNNMLLVLILLLSNRANCGLELVAMSCGPVTVIMPEFALTVTLFAVPNNRVTPVLDIKPEILS